MEVNFDVAKALNAIDAEGLRIQSGFSGPDTYWFLYFRQAMGGLSSRLYGARLHYNFLHSWWPRRIVVADDDYHLANSLFNMDSAIECLVFGLNALGNAKDVAQFHDVADEAALKRVRASNIIGPRRCTGYETYFPSLQALWTARVDLIEAIIEYHDVTKHRHAKAGSGRFRCDAPAGFFDGISEVDKRLFSPWEEIILGPEAKKPWGARSKDWRVERYSTLEQIMVHFKPFIEESVELALSDAKTL